MEKQIIKQVAKEFNLPVKTVESIYKDWIYYIINTIKNTDYSKYNKQQSFTIPKLGKLVCNESKLNKINKNKNGRTKIKEYTTES